MNELQQIPLRDIHLPEAVSWWPPAYGWWLLALVLGVFVGVVWWLVRRRPARRRATWIRKSALRELDAVETCYRASGDARAAVAAMSVLLRRFALGLAPREQVASLTGQRWLHWLRQRCDDPGFQGTGEVLTELPYQPNPQLDVMVLFAECRDFIRSAREIGSRA
ncbi:MAG: DUF4381 domain-containing protein [Gammaproteobacteria bacterium]|nr:DUF4381 domain-containing protein [Gammaproteobacteria bacterium]